MTAFDAAMVSLLSDPNFTATVTYIPADGSGPVTLTRARISALPEQMQGSIAPVHSGTGYQATFLAADLPEGVTPAHGDEIDDGTTTWEVYDAPPARHGAYHLPLQVKVA